MAASAASSSYPSLQTTVAGSTQMEAPSQQFGGIDLNQTAAWSSQGKTIVGGNIARSPLYTPVTEQCGIDANPFYIVSPQYSRRGEGSALNQLSRPFGIFIDINHHDTPLYIVDSGNHRVLKYTQVASQWDIIFGGHGEGGSHTQLSSPHYITVDPKDGTIYVSDTKNKRIQVLPRGVVDTPQSIQLDYEPMGVTLGTGAKYLYVSDRWGDRVLRYFKDSSEETVMVEDTDWKPNIRQLNQPYQIYVDNEESVYIANYDNHSIVKWAQNASEGKVVAGGNQRGSQLNQLSYPTSVYVDRQKSVYVTDYGNNRVMRWLEGATSGTVVVGTGEDGFLPDQLSNPQDLTFDRNGNLYVSDSDNHRVQMFKGVIKHVMNDDELQNYYNQYILVLKQQRNQLVTFDDQQLHQMIQFLFATLQLGSDETSQEQQPSNESSDKCQVCSNHGVHLVTMKACHHRMICLSCFSLYITEKIKSEELVPWISCPSAFCSVPIDSTNILGNANLSTGQLLSFVQTYMRQKLVTNHNVISCQNCSAASFLQLGTAREETVQCNICNTQQKIRKGTRDLDRGFKEMIDNGLLRACPFCRHLMMKDKRSCNVVRCVKCHHYWDWGTNEAMNGYDLHHALAEFSTQRTVEVASELSNELNIVLASNFV